MGEFKVAHDLLVAYGSETGTAKEVAERLGREAFMHHFNTTVLPMNEVSLGLLLNSNLVALVTSTTGQGDNPENMRSFFQMIWQIRSNRTLLKHMKYGVLGLGDSSYQKFNYSAKRLNNLILYLGGNQLLKIGLADDQHDLGPDFVVNSWLKNWWKVLMNLYELPDEIYPLKRFPLLPPRYVITFINHDENDPSRFSDFQNDSNTYSSVNPYFSKLIKKMSKTSYDHFQDVRLLEFDFENINLQHNPGDVLVIPPHNLKENVDSFINILGLKSSQKIKLAPRSFKNKLPPAYILPQPCTIRQCVERYFDIQAVPRRYFFELLSNFTTSEMEKEKFLELCSTEGQEELYSYCTRPKRSILEVLADFPHTNKNIPFEYLFELIPPIYPRSYSIASSSMALPGKVQILVALVNYTTILKKPRLGLCSNWLATLNIGSRVPLWIKPGSFKFPSPSDTKPVIMIGPGTGCAPFRAYIQECCHFNSKKSLTMLFGCRGKYKDFFFKDEWEKLSKEENFKLLCAFSRDQENKIYVQHIMRENVNYLWELIGKLDAQIFYAGSAKRIPIDVYEAIEYICKQGGKMNNEGAANYMKKNVEKRYTLESWV